MERAEGKMNLLQKWRRHWDKGIERNGGRRFVNTHVLDGHMGKTGFLAYYQGRFPHSNVLAFAALTHPKG
jgi:hypothetical protein